MRHQAHAAPRFGIGRTVLNRLPEPSLDPPLDPSLASSFDPFSFGATSCDRTMTVNSDVGSPFDPPDAAPLAVKGECKPASLAQPPLTPGIPIAPAEAVMEDAVKPSNFLAKRS